MFIKILWLLYFDLVTMPMYTAYNEFARNEEISLHQCSKRPLTTSSFPFSLFTSRDWIPVYFQTTTGQPQLILFILCKNLFHDEWITQRKDEQFQYIHSGEFFFSKSIVDKIVRFSYGLVGLK